MFRTTFISTSAAALFALASPALAQTAAAPATGAYGTLGGTHTEAGGSDANFEALQGRLGYKFHPNFGVEAEGAVGVSGYDTTIAGVATHLKQKHSLGAYAVASAPIGDRFEAFARLGYGTTRIRAETPTVAISDANDSINYGVGGQYMFTDKDGLRADWTRHDFRHDQGKADVWGLSYVRKF